MSLSIIAHGIGVVLMVLGAILVFITALGLVRLPNLLTRMHAATKPQVLGLLLFCGGVSLVLQDVRVATTMLLVIVLQLIAAPISAHMLSNAAFRSGRIDRSEMVHDQFTEDLDEVRRAREG